MANDKTLEESEKQENHYAAHLAEVNEKNDVVATQDIVNQNKLLVARQGTRINHDTANRIVQHKLLQPLEEQIRLKNILKSSQLREGFENLLEKYPDVMKIHSVNNFHSILYGLVVSNILHPLIQQELTIMRECLPEHYDRTLFCTWLSVFISSELGFPEDLIRAAFVASLAADVGLLHISPDILKKQNNDTMDPAEWRAIQSHVVIGQLLMKKIAGENSVAARAILEHHERCDGSGYPAGKTDEHLDIMGQIICLSNSIYELRIKNFADCGRNMQDTLPYLKINKYTNFEENNDALISAISKAGLEPSHVNPLGDVTSLVSHLQFNGKKFKGSVSLLEQMINKSESSIEAFSVSKLLKVTQPVLTMIKSSGLVDKELLAWLATLQEKNDETKLDDLLEIELMQTVLYFQLKKVCKAIKGCLEENADVSPEYIEHLRKTYGQINGFLLRFSECIQVLADAKKNAVPA